MTPSVLARIFDTRSLRAAQAVLLAWLLLRPAVASGQPSGGSGGMPWEGPLQNLIDSLTGPVAKAIGIAAIVCLGIGIAFAEGGGMLRRLSSSSLGSRSPSRRRPALLFGFSNGTPGLRSRCTARSSDR
jgi:type IV secretion system protein VirB2